MSSHRFWRSHSLNIRSSDSVQHPIDTAGDSAGGNIVAAVTLLAKQRGGPKLDFQVLFYPNTDASFSSESYKQFASGYFLSREDMEWFLDQYLPDKSLRKEPTATPLNATLDQLTGLPPALVITGECDVLRDEGEAYARKLMEAGVVVTATRYLGTIHGFVTLNPLANTPAARSAIAQTAPLCEPYWNWIPRGWRREMEALILGRLSGPAHRKK